MSFERFLVAFVVVLIAAKIGGEIAERLKQPAVLGELLAGILVGTSVMGQFGGVPVIGPPLAGAALDDRSPVLKTLSEVGAVLLLFEAGLDSDINELRRLGFAALWVACVGVALPFGMGYAVAHQKGFAVPASVFLGAALTATSVGITARTFADLRMTHRAEAKIVLGAAVADDVLGLILLALVSGMAAVGGDKPARSPVMVVGAALLFLVGSLVVGRYGAPMVLRYATQMRTRAALASIALIFCLVFAAAAHFVGGLAPIVGAFAAGLMLARTEHRLHLEARLKPVADIFVPFFFVMMGASMPIRAVNPFTEAGRTTLWLAGGLLLVAVVSKVLAGLTLPPTRASKGVSRWLIGFGMVPRGEVGLIFASVGLTKGLISSRTFSAIVLMVMFTTFLTPPLLRLASSWVKHSSFPDGTGKEAEACAAAAEAAVAVPA